MTDSAQFFDAHLGASRTMVILRSYSPEDTVALCERAAAGGAGLIEVPVQSADAFPSLEAAIAWGAQNDTAIGAGTVTTSALATKVADAGAAFTVAPGLDHGVVKASADLGMAHLPGVGTATEAQAAINAGLTWLKAFPATVLTPAWITAMLGPFPTARFVVTGGVNLDNAHAFLDAGAVAVSLGGSFATADPAQVRALHA